MPIQLPNLDNKTFDELLKEMIASIPKYTKEWTNFNPSDIGITILELLCWISETLIYRANRIPEESYMNFLRLVSGSYRDEKGKLVHVIFDETDNAHIEFNKYLDTLENGQITKDIQQMKASAQKFLNSKYRAVTEDDFKELTIMSDSRIKRAEVIVRDNMVEIVIILGDETFVNDQKDLLVKNVETYFGPRKLIGTVINVKMAKYTDVTLRITFVCENYAKRETVKVLIRDAITTYLDSIVGGPEGKGWPYGRDLTVYELLNIAENVEGVKYVKEITTETKNDFEVFKVIKIDGLIKLKELELVIEEEK